MTDQQRVRIGIIGTGDIAGAHARAYAQLDFVDLVAVTDVVPGRAAAFVARHALLDAVGYDDHHALLASDVDAVSICTPNVSHHALSIDALRAGKQVLVEKPMSVTLDQAIEMVQVANAEDRMLSIGFQPRYDPSMERVRELVQSGALGDVYYVETGGGRRRGIPGGTFIRKAISGAGAMADIGCYSLDLALNTLGYPRPVSVSAFTADHFGTNPLYTPEASSFDVEDFGVAMVRFETDLVLQFKISWAMHMDSLGSTMFLGTDAGLKIEPHGTGPWSGVWDGKIGSIRMFHDLLGEPTYTEVPVVEHSKDLFAEKIRVFAEAVRDGGDAPIPGSEILYQQAIIDGVLRSADARREVEIDLRGL